MIHGGRLHEIPKPWKFLYKPQGDERRLIKVKSHVWPVGGPSLGAQGHHHVDVVEANNAVWDVTGRNFPGHDGGEWVEPWSMRFHSSEPGYSEYMEYIAGRSDMNSDLIRKKDVVKWVVGVLQEWGVTRHTHKIEWELDDDDPLADITLAREMRKRAMIQD